MRRRDWLKRATTVAAAPLFIPAAVLGRQGSVPPSDRVTIGGIGVGNRGGYVVTEFAAQKDARVVAICDVNSNARDKTLSRMHKVSGDKSCREYSDFREILARKDIDAVMIATPDHWHVPLTVAAAQAGKDIFCEKPFGLAVSWDQAARAAVRRHGAVFQFGTPQRTHRMFEPVAKLLLDGAIGEIKKVRVWVPDSEWNRPAAVGKPVPVPDYLDWNMWLGPAPFTPYLEGKERAWYGISDYCVGTITNWGVHMMDVALWGLSNRTARFVDVEGAGRYPRDGIRDVATGWDVTFRYDNGVEIEFKSYGRIPEEWKRRYRSIADHGVAFEGTQGWIYTSRRATSLSAEPASLLKDMVVAPDYLKHNSVYLLVRNFMDCVQSRHTPAAGIDEAFQGDVTCILADMAMRLNMPLRWDLQQERFINNEAANRLRSRAMRSPWQV